LDLRDGIQERGAKAIADRYSNLFEMYQKITGEDAYQVPMKIYPAVHYVMGGLWVDYGLMTTIPGLFAIGEANFSDHGANRLGASALMQGLADGYFIIPTAIGDYLGRSKLQPLTADPTDTQQAVTKRLDRLLGIQGQKTATRFHRELGQILWDKVGMARSAEGLMAARSQIQALKAEFWENLKIPGESDRMNKDLELAGRVADFLELGDLMATDALERQESCGAHFRTEFQTPTGEAQRQDENYSHVTAWEYQAESQTHYSHQESLMFKNLHPTTRNYQ
jgi:succinate dehydrogenase / fumarate reductase, flavoprotein subunit